LSWDYRVIPLNLRVARYATELCAIENRLFVQQDARRDSFYDVETRLRWFYVHIHVERQKLYVIASWNKPGNGMNSEVNAISHRGVV